MVKIEAAPTEAPRGAAPAAKKDKVAPAKKAAAKKPATKKDKGAK
jgi:hypothetical protein